MSLQKALNVPNALTLLRIALVPLFIGTYYGAMGTIVPALLFLITAATDLIDGYLARRRSEVTKIGKILDPLADKLLVIAALVLLVESGAIAAWIAVVIIGREMVVTGLRAIVASEGTVFAAEIGGKYKMLLQVLSIFLLLLPYPFFLQIGRFFLIWAMVLALISAWRYFIAFGHQARLS